MASEAIEALRRELGFEVKASGTDKNYTSCTIIDYGNGFSQVANDAEVKLWAALLAEREKNLKLERALKWYADENHYGNDDWGVRGVVQPPEYGKPGTIASRALLEGKE